MAQPPLASWRRQSLTSCVRRGCSPRRDRKRRNASPQALKESEIFAPWAIPQGAPMPLGHNPHPGGGRSNPPSEVGGAAPMCCAVRPTSTTVLCDADYRRRQTVALRKVFAKQWHQLPLPPRSQRPDAILRMPRPSRRAWTSPNNLRARLGPRRPMRSLCVRAARARARTRCARRAGPAHQQLYRARCRRADRLRPALHGGRRRRRQETAMYRWRRCRAASRRHRCRRGWEVRPWWMAPFPGQE